MKLVYWAFAAVLIFAAVLFALSNRQLVELAFWPIPGFVETPAFAVGLGAFALGFLAGGFVVWLRAVAVRVRARSAARRAERLQREVEDLRAQLDAVETADAPGDAPDAIAAMPGAPRKIASVG